MAESSFLYVSIGIVGGWVLVALLHPLRYQWMAKTAIRLYLLIMLIALSIFVSMSKGLLSDVAVAERLFWLRLVAVVALGAVQVRLARSIIKERRSEASNVENQVQIRLEESAGRGFASPSLGMSINARWERLARRFANGKICAKTFDVASVTADILVCALFVAQGEWPLKIVGLLIGSRRVASIGRKAGAGTSH